MVCLTLAVEMITEFLRKVHHHLGFTLIPPSLYMYIYILTQLSHFLPLSESTLFLAAALFGLLLLGRGGGGGGHYKMIKIMS